MQPPTSHLLHATPCMQLIQRIREGYILNESERQFCWVMREDDRHWSCVECQQYSLWTYQERGRCHGLEHHSFHLADQVYLQDLPQLPYMPVSESPYASPSLYKCASDPSSNSDVDRPRMSPAQLAGVHVANPRDAAAMFTYSSEPTAMAASSMVHSAGARLSESQFHDVAWVSHPRMCRPPISHAQPDDVRGWSAMTLV